MPETHMSRSRCARHHGKRSHKRRLGASLEHLESRLLMSADDFGIEDVVIADVLAETDPIAQPAVLVPGGNPNTTAASLLAAGGPGDPTQPGFSNVARSGENGTVVYLGAGWALTANHVSLTSSITWAGKAYSVDTSSVTRLKNADGSNTDLKMFKVNGDPPLPELFTSFIASEPASGHVFMVGNGLYASGEQYWSVNKTVMPWAWTEIGEPANPNTNNYAGVSTTTPRAIRWGENMVQDSGLYMPIGGVSVASFTTRFDRQPYTNQPALPNEAQASTGDSGGAVFSLENDRWVLSGIMVAISGSMSGQPSNTAIYGSLTVSADLSVYRTQILAIAGVVNRRLLYNNSAFDGNSPQLASNEDGAIAPDKTAYLPGAGLATFDSISSYSRGINSVVVDVASVHGRLSADDFSFRIGANNSPETWTEGPLPTLISVRPGAGEGGSDRVHIIWPDGAIFDVWLEVTMKGNDAAGGFNTNTGLAKTDVFYFGHRPGDAGSNSPAAATTTASDELSARFNVGPNETITALYDFDRNRSVTAADQLFARSNVGLLRMLDLPSPVAAKSLVEETVDVSSMIEVSLETTRALMPPLIPAHDAIFAELANRSTPLAELLGDGSLSVGTLGNGSPLSALFSAALRLMKR